MWEHLKNIPMIRMFASAFSSQTSHFYRTVYDHIHRHETEILASTEHESPEAVFLTLKNLFSAKRATYKHCFPSFSLPDLSGRIAIF